MIFQRCSLPRPRCWLTFPISLTLFPYFCSHFSVLKLLSWILSLLCLLLAITSAFLHLLPSALTTLIIDLISLLFTNPVSSSIDFLCYPDFKLLIVTVITAFFISSNWLICCRWRKVIFLTSTFLSNFFDDFSTLFYHVFLFLPRQKNFFTTFLSTANTINHVLLPECQFYIFHIFESPNFRFEQLIATTKSCCSVIPPLFVCCCTNWLFILPSTIEFYSELTTNLTTAYTLTTETTSCFWSFSNQQAQQHLQHITQFMLPHFYNCTLTSDFSTSKHNRHWKQQMQRDKQHASTTPPQFVLQFPLPIMFNFDTAIDNEIHNCFTFHVAFPTTISSLMLNTQIQHLALLHSSLNFPLPLCSIFDTAIDNEIHNCFYNSCCISTAIELLQLPCWQRHTSLHNSSRIFSTTINY